MSLDKPKKIEEYILRHLQAGPMLMLTLVEKIKNDRPKTTKQAVYAALRVLKKTEQILTYKGMASLNLTWLNSMVNYFNLAKHSYIKGDDSQSSFIDLEDKEKIKYYFRSPIKADVFWTHALYLLVERSKPGEPVFLYNPHEWFLLARKENEQNIFKTINRNGHRLLLTAGNSLFLDKYIKKYFDNDLSQYHAKENPLFEENNYYLNIVGDFLIEVWLDKKMADKIDKLYQEAQSWDDNIHEKLNAIIDTESRMKIVISKNRKKAEKLRASLKKYFVLK
ncbi:MAG: hypothetical protein WC523_07635 [Patescibacteria group bacterium]